MLFPGLMNEFFIQPLVEASSMIESESMGHGDAFEARAASIRVVTESGQSWK
jgi:hypothetical protein